jgi:YfiR/HmsC-like
VALCVLGKDPFGESLDHVVRGETVNGRPLVVRRPRNPAETRTCQIVFLARAERAYQDEILSSIEGASILTVGEDEGFLTGGGIVRFVLEENRVRFEINLAAAEANGLRLSSKLLRLARAVYPAQAPQARPGS